MFYVFLLLIAAAGAGVYLLFFMSHVPGAAEERFGKLEPLPEGVGKWQIDETSDAAQSAKRRGLKREIRYWHYPDRGIGAQGELVLQVRLRNLETNAIEEVLPEQTIKRRRIKGSPASKQGAA